MGKYAMFTQRHFEAIAQVLKDTKPPRPGFDATPEEQRQLDLVLLRWEFIVTAIANRFANDNHSFNRHRFNAAAGYDNAPSYLDRVDDPDSYDREVH